MEHSQCDRRSLIVSMSIALDEDGRNSDDIPLSISM